MNACPKCGRPLEDSDESYICCSDQVLQWHCTDCGKVSEGFAMPYGMCGYCGGKLEMREAQSVTQQPAVEAIRQAFEIEMGGQSFYVNASKTSADPVLKDLFERFALMEAEHMQTLARRYHVDPDAVSGEINIDRAAIYSGVENHPEDPANLLRIAIAFEKRAVKFFEEQGEKADAGSAEQQLYKELAAEEREHVALLATELVRFQSGKPGMMVDVPASETSDA